MHRRSHYHGHELRTLRLPNSEKPRTRITTADSLAVASSTATVVLPNNVNPPTSTWSAVWHEYVDVPERGDRIDHHLAGEASSPA